MDVWWEILSVMAPVVCLALLGLIILYALSRAPAARSDSLPFTPQLPPVARSCLSGRADALEHRLLTQSGHERPKITVLLISEPYSLDHKTLL